MNLKLDHIIIAVHDLDQAVNDYRELGFTVIYGGEHAAGTTHNALICFTDGTYFELLALTGKSAAPGNTAMDFSYLVQGAEGLAGFALYTDDIHTAAEHLQQQMVIVSPIYTGSRTRTDGVTLKWRTITIDGDLYPFVLEDETPRNLRVPSDTVTTTHTNGATGITRLIVPAHHERIAQALAPVKIDENLFNLGDSLLEIGSSATVYVKGLTQALTTQKTHGIMIDA